MAGMRPLNRRTLDRVADDQREKRKEDAWYAPVAHG